MSSQLEASDHDKVWAAADQITSRGDAPTVAAVRTLAGVGQAATLQHLRSWREDQARQRIEAAVLPDLPKEVADLNGKWVEQLWRAALAQARSDADAAQAKADAMIAAVRAEADELATNFDDYTQEIARERQKRDDLVEEMRRQVQALDKRLGEARAAKAETENQLSTVTAELALAKEENTRLAGQLAGVREALAAIALERGDG